MCVVHRHRVQQDQNANSKDYTKNFKRSVTLRRKDAARKYSASVTKKIIENGHGRAMMEELETRSIILSLTSSKS